MSNNRLFVALHRKIASDERINVWHISLYMAILSLHGQNTQEVSLRISRQQLMKLARFGSIVTYHKCIGQLHDYGYIRYQPSYDHYQGSMVTLVYPKICAVNKQLKADLKDQHQDLKIKL